MKELIRHILREEVNRDNVDKGITIAVKMLKKKYPFVVGWKYANDPDEYKYSIYITLKVDHPKMMDFYGLGPHPRFHKFLNDTIKDEEKLSFPYSMTNYQEVGFNDTAYLKLENDLTDIYNEMIPSKLKMKRTGAVFNQDDPKELGVDNYIFVR